MNFELSRSTKNSEQLTICICTSPFQAHILLRIIEDKKIKPIIFYFCQTLDNRTKNYLERLRLSALEVNFFCLGQKRVLTVLPFLEYSIRRLPKTIDRVLVASFNAFYPVLLIKRVKASSIELFDDGVFSILSNQDRSDYLKPFKESWAKDMINKVLGISWSRTEILKKASKLHTIFPDYQTLLTKDKVSPIQNWNWSAEREIQVCPISKIITLYIGDVEVELSQELLSIDEDLYQLNEIDYHLPHPRGIPWQLKGHKSLSLDVIAEEFIDCLLKAGFYVQLIGFCSTVFFTLPKHNRLKRLVIGTGLKQLPSLTHHLSAFDIRLIDETCIRSELICFE